MLRFIGHPATNGLQKLRYTLKNVSYKHTGRTIKN